MKSKSMKIRILMEILIVKKANIGGKVKGNLSSEKIHLKKNE